jgi:hypothetical protein
MCWRALIDGQPVGDFVDQAAAIDFVRAVISRKMS